MSREAAWLRHSSEPTHEIVPLLVIFDVTHNSGAFHVMSCFIYCPDSKKQSPRLTLGSWKKNWLYQAITWASQIFNRNLKVPEIVPSS